MRNKGYFIFDNKEHITKEDQKKIARKFIFFDKGGWENEKC